MTTDKLEILRKHRDAILLAEIGALIHDLGKLSEEFVRSKCIEESDKKWIHHTAIIELDVHRGVKYSNDVKKILKNVKINLDKNNSINLYDFILGHHPKNWGRKEKWDKPESFEFEYPPYNEDPIPLKFIIASDTFDSEEDRGKAKDKQKSADETFKSTAFGIEKDKINIGVLEKERQEVYKTILDYFDKNLDRFELLTKLKDYCFSKALGMTARAANDVTLWDHSYMTATIMKALVAYRVLDSNFVVKSKQEVMIKKPFKIFAVGWDFFGFIGQSHKIPDVIGRIKVINEIKKEIKHIVEEKYTFGNSIYEDDFGIYFLIPSVLDEEDLKEVKEKIFNTFNCKTNGILLPVFHLEKPKLGAEFRIGKLLTEAMEKIKEKIDSHQIELITTPAWVEDWTNPKDVELFVDKLVCNVCGKRFYYKGDDEGVCEACKDIRSKGREKEIPQTVFIDEIAWNPEKKGYENVCLLIAKFDLDEWLNGRFVQSLFVRAPDIEKIQWLRNFYNSKLCREEDGNLVLNESLIEKLLSLGALYGYLRSRSEKARNSAINQIEECLKIYNSLDNFSKKLLWSIKDNLEKSKELIDENTISELQKVFSELNPQKIIDYFKSEIRNFEECILTQDDRYKKYEQQIIKNTQNLKEILHELFQKPPSPSRLMRVWRDTTNFFSTVARKIGEKSPDVVACNIEIKDFTLKGKKLVEGLAYIVKIPKLGVSGEVVCEKNCEMPEYFRVITPHLSEFLINNENKAIGIGIEIYHPERKNLVAIATIDGIVPVGSYKAYRTISISPTLFMAIIPASKSMEIVKMIKEKYLEHFGKVFGKLPLHIGLIYFKRKMPIFAVLDSAMRMINEFESLRNEDKFCVVENPRSEDDYMILELNSTKEGEKSFKYKAKIPYKLGDRNPDYYHPYLIVENSSDDVIEIKINGNSIVQKHISKIRKDDTIKIKKYYIDFEFLDSNIRRFDIGAKRKHWLFTNSTNKPKPYLLWDIDNFERLRKLIQKLGLTTTQIMNLYEMLIAKIEEWEIREPPIELLNSEKEDKKKAQVFEKLVENTIKDMPLRLEIVDGETRKGKISKEDFEFLKTSILTGMFFDFVDLWHTILKFKFEKGGENESI